MMVIIIQSTTSIRLILSDVECIKTESMPTPVHGWPERATVLKYNWMKTMDG